MPLCLSGIRSSLSLMLYALIDRKDSGTNSRVSGGARVAHPMPGCWSLSTRVMAKPSWSLEGSNEGAAGLGSSSPAKSGTAARSWGLRCKRQG